MRFSFVSMCPFRAFVSDLDTITSCLSRADWPSGPLRDVAWVLSVTLVRTESETMKTETMRAALTATATKAAALRRRSSRAGNSSPLLTFFPSGSRGRRVAWSRRLGGCLEPRNRGEEPECVEGTDCGRRLRLSRESRRLPISRGPQSLRPKPHKRPSSASSMRFWSKLVAMPRWIVSRLSVCGGLKMFRSSRSGGPTVSLTP